MIGKCVLLTFGRETEVYLAGARWISGFGAGPVCRVGSGTVGAAWRGPVLKDKTKKKNRTTTTKKNVDSNPS